MDHSVALVTGATSGLGYAAACLLARDGWREIIVTGRRLAAIQETAAQLASETKRTPDVFMPLALDLDDPSSVRSAVAALVKRPGGRPVDFLLLNAGLVSGSKRVVTAAGVEASHAPLIGHHQLTVGLLRARLVSPSARIVVAGAEPARDDVPLFSLTDVAALADRHHDGDRAAAIEAVIRGGGGGGPNAKFLPNRAYADTKLYIAWWAAALARRLPSSAMAVYAVSPGSAPDTKAARNAGPAVRYLMVPLLKLLPGWTMTPEEAACRYLEAAAFGTDVSGQFFASPPGKLTGPIEAMRHPHLHDRASQEAAWQAVVHVSGADLSGDPLPVR